MNGGHIYHVPHYTQIPHPPHPTPLQAPKVFDIPTGATSVVLVFHNNAPDLKRVPGQILKKGTQRVFIDIPNCCKDCEEDNHKYCHPVHLKKWTVEEFEVSRDTRRLVVTLPLCDCGGGIEVDVRHPEGYQRYKIRYEFKTAKYEQSRERCHIPPANTGESDPAKKVWRARREQRHREGHDVQESSDDE